MVETFYEWVTHTCINESLKHVYVLVLHREGFVCSIKKYACITSMDIEEIWKQNDKNHIPCIEFRNCIYLLKVCVLLNDNKLFILKAGNIFCNFFPTISCGMKFHSEKISTKKNFYCLLLIYFHYEFLTCIPPSFIKLTALYSYSIPLRLRAEKKIVKLKKRKKTPLFIYYWLDYKCQQKKEKN